MKQIKAKEGCYVGFGITIICEFSTYFGVQTLVRGIIGKYVSHTVGSLFILVLFDLTFKWTLINKTNKQAKYNQRH